MKSSNIYSVLFPHIPPQPFLAHLGLLSFFLDNVKPLKQERYKPVCLCLCWSTVSIYCKALFFFYCCRTRKEREYSNKNQSIRKQKLKVSTLMEEFCDRYVFGLCKHMSVSKYREVGVGNVALGSSEGSSGMQLIMHWDWRWTRTTTYGQAGHNSDTDLILSVLIPVSLLHEPYQISATKHFPSYGVCILIWILQLKPTCGCTVRQKSQRAKSNA